MRRLTDTTDRVEAIYIAPEEYNQLCCFEEDLGCNSDPYDEDSLTDYYHEYWVSYCLYDKKLNTLPFFENRWQNLKSRLNCNMYDLRFDHSWNCVEKIDGRNHWKFIYTLIETNVGKSFDQTYSYFRKKTKNELHNKYFLREFGSKRHWNTYYVDEQGIIQKNLNKRFSGKKTNRNQDYYENISMLRSIRRHNQEIADFADNLVFKNQLGKRKKEWNREILTKEIELYEKLNERYQRRLKESA